MSFKNHITTLHRTFVAAIATLAAAGLHAATVPNPASGDVFIGFRASAGDGSDVSYLVNIGSDLPLRNAAAGTSFTLPIGNIRADLEERFGANWHTRSDLLWGVFGVRGTASPALIASRPRRTPSLATAPWPALDQTGRSAAASTITGVLNGIGGYRSSTATANSAFATFQQNSSAASSYNFQVATPGTSDFSSLSRWSSIEADFALGSAASVLDLHRIFNSNGTELATTLGRLTISSAGVVTFTAASAAISPTLDTDGDGWTDLQEDAAGTDPNNGSDFFRVQSITFTPGSNNISFSTAPNRSYAVEYSETLAPGSWITIGTHTSGAAGSLTVIADTDPIRRGRPKGFYRVQVSR